ncbi:unnamed protein product [Spirodela intermedia]|uniref:Uncharacterized protein n=1 Tax=Spirodela intermedia TaxID=51605 RepID=A0A7I8INQ7_SPIIN|nr:unnamed protein product [Spirodela intermedia]CAA6659526.1 unnamed protein product [Spirodela intermedia]
MISPSNRLLSSATMGVYGSNNQMGLWNDSFKADSSQQAGLSASVDADAKLDHRLEDIPLEISGPEKKLDQEADKPSDKMLRRLAQNREAARKSRLKKKAYIQQLESTRTKLSQIESELENAKRKGIYRGGSFGDSGYGLSATIDSGLAAFEMEYGHWVEEQNKYRCELRAALQAHISEIELRILVESVMSHYDELFRIKAAAAKADIFYLMSGMWKTSAERFFLWIGGFRPSELLKVLSPQLEPLTEQQLMAAEDALSQGIDKLQQTLAESLTSDSLGASPADLLRQQTLQQLHRILTTRQAARGLLALGTISSASELSAPSGPPAPASPPPFHDR